MTEALKGLLSNYFLVCFGGCATATFVRASTFIYCRLLLINLSDNQGLYYLSLIV